MAEQTKRPYLPRFRDAISKAYAGSTQDTSSIDEIIDALLDHVGKSQDIQAISLVTLLKGDKCTRLTIGVEGEDQAREMASNLKLEALAVKTREGIE